MLSSQSSSKKKEYIAKDAHVQFNLKGSWWVDHSVKPWQVVRVTAGVTSGTNFTVPEVVSGIPLIFIPRFTIEMVPNK